MPPKLNKLRRCKKCYKPIRPENKSGYCSNCGSSDNLKRININKGYVFLLLGLFFIGLVIAETETQPVNQNVELKFTCTLNNAIPSAAAKYNITISYPNGTTFINNQETTALGNGAFSYNTYFPLEGLYKVQMFCYDGTYSFSDEGYYNVNPTGRIQNSILNNPLFLILGIIGLVLVIFGAYQGIPWFGFIGSVLFILLGIYTMIYGFDDITNLYTRGVAIVMLGMGFIFMFASAYEWLYADGGKDEEN